MIVTETGKQPAATLKALNAHKAAGKDEKSVDELIKIINSAKEPVAPPKKEPEPAKVDPKKASRSKSKDPNRKPLRHPGETPFNPDDMEKYSLAPKA